MGLSPRVRGNPGHGVCCRRYYRSIPACAGEPVPAWPPQSRSGVYPRVCGGTDNRQFFHQPIHGLSPRVRGNHREELADLAIARSIPACAGEPPHTRRFCSMPTVYPRVCGGTAEGRHGLPLTQGLSPRVRGNQEPPLLRKSAVRSIPACAGEPPLSGSSLSFIRVYPRVCGGTLPWCGSSQPSNGLSPRVRGNQPGTLPNVNHAGSIPACAGEPPAAHRAPWPASVYPRVCGGTFLKRRFNTPPMGLSPRVRGNLQRRAAHRGPLRSIPACAGEPLRRCYRPQADQVYPRVCGGTGSRVG